MKTVLIAIASLLGTAALPAFAQDESSAEFDKAFASDIGEDSPMAEMEQVDEQVGEWRVYDGPTAAGERRVFMHKDLGPDRFIEVDLQAGGGVATTFVDADCHFGASFDVQELGTARAAGLHDKFAEMLDTDSCNAQEAVPTIEDLIEPLARLEEWVAERPFPAASFWKPEERQLTIGSGLGRGVGRYEGRVSIVYLEPGEDSRGPAEVIVNIYNCDAFEGRPFPVRSGDPAQAQEIALAVLEQRAEACELDPAMPARMVDGLPEGLADIKSYAAKLAEDSDYGPDADDLEAQADLLEERTSDPTPLEPIEE